MAPDRAGPGGIAFGASHHMDMQLRHHIAQIADIELLHPRQSADQVGQFDDLGHQLGLVLGHQVAHFDGAGAARHQQAPLIAAVIVEKEAAERPVGQLIGQLLDDGVDGELAHDELLLNLWAQILED